MLEVAAHGYRDVLDALGKLADWMEQAGRGSLPAGSPPDDLVRQFNEALGEIPAASVQTPQPATAETTPADLISRSGLFSTGDHPVGSVDAEKTMDGRVFATQRREINAMTEAQEVNLDRGLKAVDEAVKTQSPDFLRTAETLSELLSKPAAEISPVDLLQAQRLMGVLKVHAETGKKVSEGISDTLEQTLEQQG